MFLKFIARSSWFSYARSLELLVMAVMNIRNLLLAGSLVLAMGHANAELFDRGNGLIYDDDRGITWLAKAEYSFGPIRWFGATSWAENLAYHDVPRGAVWSDWRLPTNDEMSHLYFAELGGILGGDLRYTHNSNYSLFPIIYPGPYWSQTDYYGNPSAYAMTFNFYNGSERSEDKFAPGGFVLAVRRGDVGLPISTPIPEPNTYALLLTGLGLLGVTMRRRSRQVAY